MKKYKLIREYPGSPELGAIVQDTNPNNGAKDSYFSLNWGTGKQSFIVGKNHNCENQPEFWQEIIEKKYEILKQEYYPGNHSNSKIISIKRLSDGEIFTIGDKIKNSFSSCIGNILSFNIEGKGIIINKSYDIGFNEISHVKKPLFKTTDGVDIFKNDECWVVINNTLSKVNWKNNHPYEIPIYFSTKEIAEEYILMNKPSLFINDIIKIKDLNMTNFTSILKKIVKSKS